MRTLLFLACLMMFSAAYADNLNEMHTWSVMKARAPTSWTAEFECKKGGMPVGKVVRTGLLCPRYQYDLFSTHGRLEARAITRALSWGLLFPWGTQIDLYDDNAQIGMIGGVFFTWSRAKFVFYNAQGEETAIAYLNSEASEFLIVSAKNEEHVLAELKGRAFGALSVWEMKPTQPVIGIDERILKVFIAFATDFHESFKKPSEVHYNNYYPGDNGYNSYR
jgi:hypothetical protein